MTSEFWSVAAAATSLCSLGATLLALTASRRAERSSRSTLDSVKWMARDGERRTGAFLASLSGRDERLAREASLWSWVPSDGEALASFVLGSSVSDGAVALGMVPSSVAAAAADGIRSGRFGAGAGSTATLMAALSRLSELSTISTRELSRVEALLAGTLPHGALSLSEADLDGARRSAALMASSSSSEEFMDELSVFSSSASSAVSLASFRFDDAARLSDADMAALLRAISKDALCLALVNARGETAEAFFSRLSSGAERMLREDVAILSDISTGVSAEAAERVVDTARVLAGDGLISLPPPL